MEKFGQMARFGFIHLVATNLSVWFRMVIWDSAHEWVHFVHLHAQPDRPLQYGGTPSPSALRLQGEFEEFCRFRGCAPLSAGHKDVEYDY